ncbi:uncharacterized protein LOC100680038 [Nasonia vitripennis]|uniref:Uncharacterized protein n=1 Tax=Nasonia vitripennis TaxID=7425 RepID=A0A7M7GDS7_NASVI|nr:uncharacterized protein LOC100680038 [Nasonia vitripennis]
MTRFKAATIFFLAVLCSPINGDIDDKDGGVLTYLKYDPLTRPLNMTAKVFAEAECNDGIVTKKACKMIFESVPMNGAKSGHECRIEFETEKDHQGIAFLRPLATINETVIISYHDIIKSTIQGPFIEEGFRVYSIIDMRTCKFHDARIFYKFTSSEQLLTPETPILTYNDGTFDVFVSGKDICSGGRCKLTFNLKGERIKSPVSYLPDDLATTNVRMFPLTQASSPRNFYVTTQNRQNKTHEKLLFASPDGNVQEVMNFDVEGPLLNIDSFYDKFTFCYQVKADVSKVKCRQYDSENKKKLEVTLNLVENERQIRVHNLPEGGFLHLTTQCARCDKHNDYRLTRIQQNGQIGKPTAIDKLNCPKPHNRPGDVSEIFFGKDNQVCVRKSCDGFEFLDVVAKCLKL